MCLSLRIVAAAALTIIGPLCACRSKPPALPSNEKPAQVQAAHPNPPESADEQSCRVFVQKFYNWRISLLVDEFCSHSLKGTNATQESIDEQEEQCKAASAYRNAEKLSLGRVLSPNLHHYVQRQAAMERKEGDAGLDFDPYLNTQDPSPKFIVDSVRVAGNRCDAVVHGYDHGLRREEVMPEMSRANGQWLIENFHYKFSSEDGKPSQDDDLIHMITEYIGEIK